MTAGKTALAALLLVALMIAAPITWYFAAEAASCYNAGTASRLATSWTPWGGCTATVLGTEVRIG